MDTFEILAPAGGPDALKAAVRCGAQAVYLGGTLLSARQGAENFDADQLAWAVRYCHARGVKVHMAINTVIFSDELKTVEEAVRQGANAGVDAFIIQDLGVAEIAKACAPDIQRHASTQMAVHNMEGVLALQELGFSRAVLARELTLEEIAYIAKNSPIEIETFVHGALCMSVSGQCYASAMIGGRSGNRGRCAQTCRLPFESDGASHALSLKDLSVIDQLPELKQAGVFSFKIEGRLKRPEYVAAAVTACVDKLAGRQPDYATLEDVFSRSGFTSGYVDDQRGDHMFGRRTRQDVQSTASTLSQLAGLYHQEQPRVPVRFAFTMKKDQPATLEAATGTHRVTVTGEIPQVARKVATTPERAQAAFDKTGGTPFYLQEFQATLDEGLMMPAAQMNGLRRDALDQLIEQLEAPHPHPFTPFEWPEVTAPSAVTPRWRVRYEKAEQLSMDTAHLAWQIALPIEEALRLPQDQIFELAGKLLLELPRTVFSAASHAALQSQLRTAWDLGITQVLAGGYGELHLAKTMGFQLHGDFGLNAINYLATEKLATLGLQTLTMSMEYALADEKFTASLPRGMVAYGYLPLMLFRTRPAAMNSQEGTLTDRLDNDFFVQSTGETYTLYNMVPVYLADQLEATGEMDFYTLYFTHESPQECEDIVQRYQQRRPAQGDFTRGLAYRRIR